MQASRRYRTSGYFKLRDPHRQGAHSIRALLAPSPISAPPSLLLLPSLGLPRRKNLGSQRSRLPEPQPRRPHRCCRSSGSLHCRSPSWAPGATTGRIIHRRPEASRRRAASDILGSARRPGRSRPRPPPPLHHVLRRPRHLALGMPMARLQLLLHPELVPWDWRRKATLLRKRSGRGRAASSCPGGAVPRGARRWACVGRCARLLRQLLRLELCLARVAASTAA